jgi:hypothetical protein
MQSQLGTTGALKCGITQENPPYFHKFIQGQVHVWSKWLIQIKTKEESVQQDSTTV